MDFSFDQSRLSKAAANDYSTSDSDSDNRDDAFRKPSTDPAADDYGEFNPRKRRRIGRNGKEKAALGIFGSDSEDDQTGPGRRRGKRRQPLRQQGVSFVSSGAPAQRSDSDEDDDSYHDDADYGDANKADQEKRGELKKRKEVNVEEDDAVEDYDEDDTGSVGLGYATSSLLQDHGFVPVSYDSRKQQRVAPGPPLSVASFDANNPLGNGFVPSSAYEPVLKRSPGPEKPYVAPKPSAFSSRVNGSGRGRGGGGGSGGPNPNSFGARMMAKMGYIQGQGLGKEGHGRNIIIEANLRPQGIGLGAVREKSEKERQEEKRQARLRGEVIEDSEEEKRKKKAAAAARRKKAAVVGGALGGDSSTIRRPKTKYMTVDEIKKTAPGLHIPEAFTPILDMTGPDQKLLTSVSGLMTPISGSTPPAAEGSGSGPTAAEETAERIATKKLVRRAQTDVMAILEEWQSLQNRKAYAELQAQQEKQELSELELSLQGNTAMLHAFQQLEEAIVDESTTDTNNAEGDDRSWQARWDFTVARLKNATGAIPDSFLSDMEDTIVNISVAAIHPLVKQSLDFWDPLKDTNQHMVEGLQAIRHLLRIGVDNPSNKTIQNDSVHSDNDPLYDYHRRRKAVASPYEAMIYKLWLPHVSTAIRQWDLVRDPDSVLSLYEVWLPVLPGFVRAQLLEQDVVRKLDEAVSKWEPKRRRNQSQNQNLPHLWLFPWLPYLPSRHLDPRSADGLVSEVKRKFRQLVDVWEFYRGVVPGLRQWKALLRSQNSLVGGIRDDRADQWRPIVMSHLLPSMGRYVRSQFCVDPDDQAPYLEVITGEFQWLLDDLLAADLVGEVLVAEAFPMWHETLYHLLTTLTSASGAEHLDQIAQWFQWWAEEVFPPAIQRLPSVLAEFERGLVMVNEALDCCRMDDGGRIIYNADQVRANLASPRKGPALASSSFHARIGHHHHHIHHRHHDYQERESAKPAVVSAVAEREPEEMSIRHYVEEWCENNDLQFIPERNKVHAKGPLYRITARGDGKGGVLAYFKGVRLYVETKKGPVEIRVDRGEDWVKLMAMTS